VITAKSGDALSEYLAAKTVTLPPKTAQALRPYLNESYSFVLAWISSRDQMQKEFPDLAVRPFFGRQPCLFVEFPTPQAFYPMRPTSTYETNVIPVRLYVTGYKDAQTEAPFREHMTRRHYRMWALSNRPTNQFTANLPRPDVPYTLFKIKAEANTFTDDLWFVPTASPRTLLADFSLHHLNGWVVVGIGLVLTALLSYVTGGLVGLLLYREWRFYAFFGLWNLCTVYGLAVQTRLSDRVPGSFVWWFTFVFVGLSLGLQALIRWAFVG
jgi:hypothetical protein